MGKSQPLKGKTTLPFKPEEFLAKVGLGRTQSDYTKRRVIFSQGDPADALYYIQRGKVKLSVVSPHGKEAVVGILGVGDFFGEGCLAGQAFRMASAAAMPACTVMCVERLK